MKLSLLFLAAGLCSAPAFEGRITAEITRGNEVDTLLYTVSPTHLRIEVTGTKWVHPINILDRKADSLTLVFPHNQSFTKLKPGGHRATETATPPGMPAMPNFPAPPAGIGPQPGLPTPGPKAGPPGDLPKLPDFPLPPGGLPAGVGPRPGPPGAPGNPPGVPGLLQVPGGLPAGVGPGLNAPGAPGVGAGFPQAPGGLQGAPGLGAFPAMPAMPPMMQEKLELKPTEEKKSILDYACLRHDLKQRGETLEAWTTEKLFPFQPYLRGQPHRFGPRMLEEQWPGLLESRKLFPLRVGLKFEHAKEERFRFEVKSIKEEKIDDPEGRLFQPPKDYRESPPLPF